MLKQTARTTPCRTVFEIASGMGRYLQRLRQLERNSDSRIPPALLPWLGGMIQNFPAEYVVETSLSRMATLHLMEYVSARGGFTPSV